MRIDVFLKNLGIADHPGLRVNPKLEGYRDYTFGCHAGPTSPNVMDLSHELAHAAQFGARYFKYRAAEYGFVFKLHRVKVLGQYYVEPRTAGATIRELETFAYQAHLLQAAGETLNLDRFFKHGADLMVRFMPDWFCIPGDTEDERRAWCIEKSRYFYRRRKRETVLRRLKEWLDETERHLADPKRQAA